LSQMLQHTAKWIESQIPVECREDIAKTIKHERKSGQLIIHFTNGTIGGMVWREKVLDAGIGSKI
jgi:hypothetical protein